jgi:hypothetical protein
MAIDKNGQFKLNPKCVLISGALVLGYWTLPKERNLLGAVLVGTGSYVGVAYYDHYFECSDRLSIDNPISQWFPFVSSLKPPIDYETRTYS